jgi:hypothetical protein
VAVTVPAGSAVVVNAATPLLFKALTPREVDPL